MIGSHHAANSVFRAEMDGDKKYSPPRGTTKAEGKASEVVTLWGSDPVVDLGALMSWPIYATENQCYNRKRTTRELRTIGSKPSPEFGKLELLAHTTNLLQHK